MTAVPKRRLSPGREGDGMAKYSDYLGGLVFSIYLILPWGALAQETIQMQCSIDDMLLRLHIPDKFSQIEPGDSRFILHWTSAYISGERPSRIYHAATIAIELPFTPLVFYKYDLLLWGAQLGFENMTPYFFEEGAERHAETTKQRYTIEDSASEIDIEGDYISYKASIHLLSYSNTIFNYVMAVRNPVDDFRHDDIIITGECGPL
jgi:hypothetical protein